MFFEGINSSLGGIVTTLKITQLKLEGNKTHITSQMKERSFEFNGKETKIDIRRQLNQTVCYAIRVKVKVTLLSHS